MKKIMTQKQRSQNYILFCKVQKLHNAMKKDLFNLHKN
jgi:hypothetical protein